MKTLLISVVIPFYNEIELIGRAVSSALNQRSEGVDIEVLIINDGETPLPVILSKIAEHQIQNVQVFNNYRNKGPGGARNCGIDKAAGEYIAFLDADDWWHEDKITQQLAVLRKGYNFVVCSYTFENSDVNVIPARSISKPEDIFLKRGIGTSTVIVTKKLIGSHRFNDYRFSQDIDFWYRLAKSRSFKFSIVDQCLVKYHSGGSTKNKYAQLLSLLQVLKDNNVRKIVFIRTVLSYCMIGIWNHYIRSNFLKR